jgi:hypothetical protein
MQPNAFTDHATAGVEKCDTIFVRNVSTLTFLHL